MFEASFAVALPENENMFGKVRRQNIKYASGRHQRADPTVAFIWSRGLLQLLMHKWSNALT